MRLSGFSSNSEFVAGLAGFAYDFSGGLKPLYVRLSALQRFLVLYQLFTLY